MKPHRDGLFFTANGFHSSVKFMEPVDVFENTNTSKGMWYAWENVWLSVFNTPQMSKAYCEILYDLECRSTGPLVMFLFCLSSLYQYSGAEVHQLQ